MKRKQSFLEKVARREAKSKGFTIHHTYNTTTLTDIVTGEKEQFTSHEWVAVMSTMDRMAKKRPKVR